MLLFNPFFVLLKPLNVTFKSVSILILKGNSRLETRRNNRNKGKRRFACRDDEERTVSAGVVPAGGDGELADDGDCSGVAGVGG